MLVLSRKNGQKIIINDNIVITILDAKYDNCKIAIEAPKEVTIFREEVYKQIQTSNIMSNEASVETIDSLTSLVSAAQEIKKPNKIIIKKKEK